MECKEVRTKRSHHVKVFIQGDIKDRAGKVVFLTVHDVGTNHRSFLPFVDYGALSHVRRKSVWLHVCLPGQDDHDETLPESYEFPGLSALAHDTADVLDAFKIRTVIGFGEGAGANILCRFGLFYPNRCLGLVLIDCTSSTAGVDEYIRHTVFNWKEGGSKLVDKVVKFLTYHKVQSGRGDAWKGKLNPENISRYLEVYLKRDDISKYLATKLKADVLLIVGSYSPYLSLSKQMLEYTDKLHTTLLVADDVSDPLYETPKNLARALILFCKGCGVLMGVPMIGLEKEFSQVEEKQAANQTQLDIAQAVMSREKRRDCDNLFAEE